MSEPEFVPYDLPHRSPQESLERAVGFAAEMAGRRSVRAFRSDPIPAGVLDACIRAAGSAPSGAHQQPWSFVVVTDPELKREIREAAEEEERANYGGRMTEEWLEVLAPLGTDANKEFLELAPALIVVFRQAYGFAEGQKKTYYYTQESVGIALGFLIVALHQAGLASLTHTPSPMGFLERVLERPTNERAYVLLPVGYPAEDCTVPRLERKDIEAIRTWCGAR